MFSQLTASVHQTNKYFAAVLKATWWLLVPIAFVTLIIFQFYTRKLGAQPTSNAQLLINLCLLLVSIVESLMVTLILFYHSHRTLNPTTAPFIEKMAPAIVPLILEGLRALAKIILFTLLLILPGVFKYVRYYFVPLIVLFDPDYQEGKVDALERSNELAKGISPIIAGLIAIAFAVQMLTDKILMSSSITENPLLVAGGIFIEVFFSTYTYLLLYHLFIIRSQEVPFQPPSNGDKVHV